MPPNQNAYWFSDSVSLTKIGIILINLSQNTQLDGLRRSQARSFEGDSLLDHFGRCPEEDHQVEEEEVHQRCGRGCDDICAPQVQDAQDLEEEQVINKVYRYEYTRPDQTLVIN